jgi:hypothetical protein
MSNFDAFTIGIDKTAIEALDFSMIRDFIAERDFNEILLYEASGRLDIFFSGYDNDRREIFEIPEIQEWIKASMIEEKIPWFFFLSTAPSSQSIKALALCFSAEPVKGKDGKTKFQPVQKNLQDFALINFSNMNDFMNEHKLTESMNIEISNRLNAYFEASFAGSN